MFLKKAVCIIPLKINTIYDVLPHRMTTNLMEWHLAVISLRCSWDYLLTMHFFLAVAKFNCKGSFVFSNIAELPAP